MTETPTVFTKVYSPHLYGCPKMMKETDFEDVYSFHKLVTLFKELINE